MSIKNAYLRDEQPLVGKYWFSTSSYILKKEFIGEIVGSSLDKSFYNVVVRTSHKKRKLWVGNDFSDDNLIIIWNKYIVGPVTPLEEELE